MRNVFILFMIASTLVKGQSITATQQKALNNYVDYANKSSEEISSLVASLIRYYPSIQQYKQRPNSMRPRYVCPLQLDEYYFKKAVTDGNVLGSGINSAIREKMNALKAAAENIDALCKELDVYHKLEDYKQDNFEKAEMIIGKFPGLLSTYKQAYHAYVSALTSSYRRLQPFNPGNPYHQASQKMLEAIEQERAFIDLWDYNLEESIHTGWPVDKLQASILDTDARVKAFDANTPSLKYPASSMYTAFKGALSSILDVKRTALDDYNMEAKKSDHHSNGVYLSLINYYDGTLIANYNSFIQYAQSDGYYGLKTVRYVTTFSLRTAPSDVSITIRAFNDSPYSPLILTAQSKPISRGTAVSLNNYVDFINECLRQTRNLQPIIRNFSSRAEYYRGLTSFEGRGALYFDFKNFKVPLSLYQKAVAESSALSSPYSKSLNNQAEVLLNILKEMEEVAAVLEVEVKERRYEKDHLKQVFRLLERYRELFDILDERKERMYDDVRAINDSYPQAEPDNSWIMSWKALRLLTDYNHEALFKAKAFYNQKTITPPPTDKIDQQVRDVITNEYTNMKGIDKLGRYHGLCPYTPYEDIPKTSKALSEKLQKVANGSTSGSRHPYDELVYLYNDVVDDYNKFCELSKKELLKQIRQPDFFVIKSSQPSVEKPNHSEESSSSNDPVVINRPQQSNASSVETVKVIRDTVYIEKRDTVYLDAPGSDLRSMEGFASNNMVLLLDVSGSMNSPDKLPLLKKSILDLVGMMRQEDQVSIVVYSGKAKVLLQPVSFQDQEKIRKAIDNLKSSGKTDGNAGIKLAYQVADKNYIRGGNNRIILATDGEFPIHEETFGLVENFAKEDIFLSVFNFGKGMGSSKNLERLSASGHGNYELITRENMELKLIREAKAKRKK